MGGSFEYMPRAGTVALECFNMSAPDFYGNENWFAVDSQVNKMDLFNGDLTAGGNFKTGYNGPFSITLNGIAKRQTGTTEVADINIPRFDFI